MEKIEYYVVGGEYENTTFNTLVEKRQFYGPFYSWKDAYDEWKRLSMLRVDNCNVKYDIVEYEVQDA